MTSPDPNEVAKRITSRRIHKAEAFALILKEAGVTPFEVERAGRESWDLVAAEATKRARAINPKASAYHWPSDDTKRLIVKFMSWADEDPFATFEGVS